MLQRGQIFGSPENDEKLAAGQKEIKIIMLILNIFLFIIMQTIAVLEPRFIGSLRFSPFTGPLGGAAVFLSSALGGVEVVCVSVTGVSYTYDPAPPIFTPTHTHTHVITAH